MAARRLDPAEAALWAKVMATVRPIRPIVTPMPTASQQLPPVPAVKARPLRSTPAPPATVRPPVRTPQTIDGSLDTGWERKIGRGQIEPDSVIDLHGHSLASAHALLDRGLGQALARGDRVLLLVTGRPPRPDSERPHARGAIRAAVKDWLAISPHGARIAAVRGSHARHGGAGALYLILRRPR